MLKFIATGVSVSKGANNTPALKFSEKGDFVRFRIGAKVYDARSAKNHRWVNLTVKAFGPCVNASARWTSRKALTSTCPAATMRTYGKMRQIRRRPCPSSFWMRSSIASVAAARTLETVRKQPPTLSTLPGILRPPLQAIRCPTASPVISLLAAGIPSSTCKEATVQLNQSA